MAATLGSIEITNILLIVIIGILGVCVVLLDKIKSAVEMSRNLDWKRHFGQPYREATRTERRGELLTRR
jgi:hypothetical protein